MPQMIPLRNCIFVLPDKTEEETKGGIILSDYSKKRPATGTILGVGAEVKKLYKGQRVVFGDFSGQKKTVKHNNEDIEIFLMTEQDILATITNE